MTRTIERPKGEKAVAPAKQWRNLYETDKRFRYANGHEDGPGIFWGCRVSPTKDVSESVAEKWMKKWAYGVKYSQGATVKYIGTFPVSE